MGESYSDPRYGVPKTDTLPDFTCNSANAVKDAWIVPRNEKGSVSTIKILQIHIVPITAGTSTGASLQVEILKNLTTMGTVDIASNTAGALLTPTAALVLTTATSGDIIRIRNAGSDAAAVLLPTITWQEQFTGTAND